MSNFLHRLSLDAGLRKHFHAPIRLDHNPADGLREGADSDERVLKGSGAGARSDVECGNLRKLGEEETRRRGVNPRGVSLATKLWAQLIPLPRKTELPTLPT